MDAYVQLALIEKSKRVFATDASIFLGFPLLSPFSYKPQALAVLGSPATAADYATCADFARAVNFLPRDMVASPDGDRYLWDVYGDVMARAEVAARGTGGAGGNMSSLLYDVAADGTRTESAAYAAYRQYRDAWIVARENYGEHKLTGEMTTDPKEKQHWTDVDEPALRAALGKAESDWKTLGRRDEIDAALQAEAAAAANDPIRRWQEWSDDFSRDLDLIHVPGGPFAPTGISPRDFASNTQWPRFELSAGEMATLIAEAPPELKVVLDSDGSAIDHISFEYRSVALVRPWFRANALTSRIWRSSDPDLILSDGASPPAGCCPAYVSAVVFIRNLKVTPRAAVAVDPAPSDLRFTIRADRLTRRRLQVDREVAPATSTAEIALPENSATIRAFQRVNVQSFTVAPTLETRAPVQRFDTQPFVAEPAARQFDPSALLRVTTPEVTANAARLVRRRRITDRVIQPEVAVAIEEAPTAQPPAGGPVATPAGESPPDSAPDDEISILAFICKRLPKTPDANPDLQWR